MISRLLLVVMVGVLGISLPDGVNLGSGLTWARTGTTACACIRETVTFEPIAVDDDSINRIADELNRQSQGVDLPMVSTAEVVATARPAAVEPDTVVDELFAENRVWGEPSAEVADTGLSPPTEPRTAFEPIVVAEGGSSLADELNRASEGLDLDPADVVPASPARPTFEPIEVAERSTSVADELNRAADGVPAVRDARPALGSALRLTRDAAMAWLNVLTRTITTASHER